MIAEIDTQTPLLLMTFCWGAMAGCFASILVFLHDLSKRK